MTTANNMQCVAVVNWPLNDYLYPQDVQNLFFPQTSAWMRTCLADSRLEEWHDLLISSVDELSRSY